jgi:hypothetical protein
VAGLSVVRDPDEDPRVTMRGPDNEPWEYPRPEGGVRDVGKSNSLADAATEAQNDGTDLTLVAEQTALVPACKVKFQGMSFNDLNDVPELKEDVAYLAEGTVVGHEQVLTAQGDIRDLAKVKVREVSKISASQLERINAILAE